MNYENQEIWSFKSYKFILSSFFLILTLSIFFSCKTDPQLNQNNLNLESSPYLLQHAQNPVHWQSWNENLYSKYYPEKKLIAELEKNYDEICARWLNEELNQDYLLDFYQKSIFIKPELYLRKLEQISFGNKASDNSKQWVSQ